MNNLEDLFDSNFLRDKPKPAPEERSLPPIRGKRVDDVLYVHAGDVAAALEQLGPVANARLIAKLRGAA